MTMTELLEQDKEKLMAQLDSASTPDRAGAVIEQEYDRLLYRYNEQCTSGAGRAVCASMTQIARTEAGLVDSIGSTKIWESGGKTPEKKIRGAAWAVLAAGAVCLAAGLAALAGSAAGHALFGLPVQLLLLAVGAVLLYLAGYLTGKPPKQEETKEQKIEMMVDAGRIYRCMQAAVLTMDQNIQAAAEEEEQEAPGADAAAAADRDEIELMAGLLEASCGGDARYALDKLNDIRYFLYKKGIDIVEYSPETADYFDLIPSKRTGTIRPALAAGGKLLKKGLAAGGDR